MNAPAKLALIVASLTLPLAQGVGAAVPTAKLWNGTWHLNAAKSKFESSGKRESETRTYHVSGNKVTMTSSSKDASGKLLKYSYSAAVDGKWYPMTGNPKADRISLKAVSGREISWSSQLHGKSTVAGKATVSADGKHLILTRNLVGGKDSPTDVLEFDR